MFQIPLTVPWDKQAEIILRIKNSLEQPIYWHEREIPTPADLCIGLNMGKKEMVELKSKEIPTNKNILGEKLKEIYDEISR